jgi:hypothetical protein
VFIGSGAVIRLLSAANRTVDLLGEDLIDDHGVMGKIPDSTGAAISTIGIWKNGSNNAQRYHRRNFTVSGVSTPPTAGAVYTHNGSTYTVLFTNAAKTLIETWMSTYVNEATASGTLTYVSGTGDASITFSAFIPNRVIPTSYISGGVPIPLTGGGGTRYGISAIYALIDDLQTPSTAAPTPIYFALMSGTAYSSAANAATSIGMTQFVMPVEISSLEPVLMGFVISDGSDRQIDNYTGNGFTAGVRSFKITPTASFSAGAVAVAAAVNVSFTPAGNIAANEVQAALEELDAEKQAAMTKAAYADVNTGTDDAKYLTSLALRGSKYARKSFVIAMS